MTININDQYDIESFYFEMREPEGYGVFDQDENVVEEEPIDEDEYNEKD